jgi:cell surface hyaluronidase
LAVGAGQYRIMPTGTPWISVLSDGSGLAANGSAYTTFNPNAPDGSQVAFLQGQGGLTQTVASWSAGTYTIHFQAAQRGKYNAASQDFRVLLDGRVVGTFRPSGAIYASYETAAFTVGAGPHTITFQGLNSNGGDNTALIDNALISLMESPK